MIDFLETFNASLARLSKDESPLFIDEFYKIFMAADPKIAERFTQTNLARQKLMLRESLEEMSVFFCDHIQSPYLQSLARVHGRGGRGIPDWMYDVWLSSMLSAVKKTDADWSATVELSWRVVMAPGMAFMKHYST